MAQTSDLTCRQAQRLLQRLLDQRWTRPWPLRLQEHFHICGTCRTWQCLFQYEPVETPDLLPANFSERVVRHYFREQTRRRWIFRGSFLAMAAAVLVTLFLGKILFTAPEQSREIAKAKPDWQGLVAAVSTEFDAIPNRIMQLGPSSFDLSLPTLAMPTPDPWEANLTPVQALGETFQGAVGPLERPAREAYQKVVEFIDEPEVQKWVQRVTQGRG
jgi:hypothetical protein